MFKGTCGDYDIGHSVAFNVETKEEMLAVALAFENEYCDDDTTIDSLRIDEEKGWIIVEGDNDKEEMGGNFIDGGYVLGEFKKV